MKKGEPRLSTAEERQARIDAAIASCTECGSYEFPKQSDCDGCTNLVDEEIASELAAREAGPGWDNICRRCWGSMNNWPGMRQCECAEPFRLVRP